ncbi:MAG: hypothetical protein RR162_02320 [Oscillospiraceae bacterium]
MNKRYRNIAVILAIFAIAVILYFSRAEINHGNGEISSEIATAQGKTLE